MLAGGDARQRSDTVDIYDTATAMAEPRFQPNVEALQLVIPADIPPEQIEVRLGHPLDSAG